MSNDTVTDHSQLDATAMAITFAKTIGRVADFAVDLAEQLHKDLGLEYKPTVHGKKTKKSVRDPNMPKKPKTAFFLFCDTEREKAKERGDGPPTTKDMAETWKSADDDVKAHYSNEQAKLKEQYEKDMNAYYAGKQHSGSGSPPPSKRDSPDTSSASEDEEENAQVPKKLKR
ncbi:conserved hypothetical protein [Perkinsus marinus ATCC 50983]|uniref:HMG box domain-containing protein n=1 Tax=Perkinsus marinus (strain ATCC 50983 / TXsc) TaxID=423536 RepID=C5KUP4_PERM5|nr:conserved hypothetical protein [Perkinsus marinus ATCC 50983]XP_002779970.1 conserved hypothetical protein [Perkinsus marinus ATCC 50983]EER10947.1 conserved hypothetical protein [Perkinsus marinus ATCC 50983]EER11765.1 conserved hypothetical protein [Perkinsus marinus ATCC 50983]|eukprot:XP_002779152.1 conserved hypothetical protein [Perkinsus marinus ATCC 50983]